jgi:arginyl-tRNA synthetase
VTPDQLSAAIGECLEAVVAEGVLVVAVPDEIRVERPKQREHGDWSTNIALQLAKQAGRPPREVAQLLAGRLAEVPGIKSVDVAGPGFLNVVLDVGAAGELVRTIVEAGAEYGHSEQLAGHVVNLEFVSANPTGPLHIGHTRWAALGDAIGRLLSATGAQVTREFYINDAGAQMDRFGESILARLRGTEIPEGGYHGEYIAELALAVRERHPDVDQLPDDEALIVARDLGYSIQIAENRQTLADFGVHFDVWFSEQTLHATGAVQQAVVRLREQGHVEDRDGAVWLRTTDFGDDKDRVLIKADGEPTYLAADAAYYLSKKDRGFKEKIYLLGADHHGYVQRLKAIAACAGDDPETSIEILIGQLVSVGGAKLSKRAGNIIELRDLVAWLGRDAVRYSLARYPADSPLALDGEVLQKRSNDNPVYYVQYAHARLCSMATQAQEHGVDRSVFEPSRLDHPTDAELIAALAQFPAIVEHAARLREPHRVARHLEVLAGAFHRWYDETRVTPRGDDPVTDAHRTRLWLAEATRTVLANGLQLLGVGAPERM